MAPGESSANIRTRVIAARDIQAHRFATEQNIHCNAQMTPRLLSRWATTTREAMNILQHAMLRFDMSARAYDRILKVARTIADLDTAANPTADPTFPIQATHMHEAVSYRNLDRSTWGLK